MLPPPAPAPSLPRPRRLPPLSLARSRAFRAPAPTASPDCSRALGPSPSGPLPPAPAPLLRPLPLSSPCPRPAPSRRSRASPLASPCPSRGSLPAAAARSPALVPPLPGPCLARPPPSPGLQPLPAPEPPPRGGAALLPVWARAVLGLVLLTLLARDRALLLWAVALACAWALGGLLLGRVLSALAVTSALSTNEAFAGETITVHLRLTNRSRFPLPWVRLDETLPRPLHRRAPRWIASLPAGETFQTEYRLRLPRRGLYRVGRVGLEVGDWFGLWRKEGYVDVPLWLTVFPRPLPAGVLPAPPRLPEGDRARPASPFRAWEPAGLREYRRGDPPRWIAWKATARRGGDLVVREFPPVRDRAHLIVLDLRPSAWPAAHRAAHLERAVALAATAVAATAERDEPVGMYTFGLPVRHEPAAGGADRGAVGASPAARTAAFGAESAGPTQVLTAAPLPTSPVAFALPARRGSVHRRQLLRALAVLEPAENPTFTRAALAALRRLSPRSSILWISGATDEAASAAAAAARAGHAVALAVPAGAAEGKPAPGVTIWPLPPGEGEEWER